MQELLIDVIIKFTAAYKDNINEPIAIREAKTVQTLYPDILMMPTENDLLIGRAQENFGFSLPLDFAPQASSQIGYYMLLPAIRRLQEEYPARKDEIQASIDFWKTEATFVKLREEAPKQVYDYLMSDGIGLDDLNYMRIWDGTRPLGSGFISGSFDTRIADVMPDFGKLIRLGIPGLRAEIKKYAAENPDGRNFYTACEISLDTVDICLTAYGKMFRQLAEISTDGKNEMRMNIADSVEALRFRAPDTYLEALQLISLFTMLLRTQNYGRLDMALGPILTKELESGTLTEEEAIQQTMLFFNRIEEFGKTYDSRIVLGGKGRPEPEKADKFAFAAIEAGRRLHKPVPCLTLRLCNEQNPQLYECSLNSISEGCIYPTLYNDEVLVPGLKHSMNMPDEDIVDYVPLGCGEMILDHKCTGSPNSTMRFLKALEAALHNGRDGADGVMIGIETGDPKDFTTYEQLEEAFYRQIRDRMEKDIQVHEWNRRRTAQEISMVMISMLTDDCIARGKGVFEGGIRYFGANTEGFGLTNSADSLMAIRQLVFVEKRWTLPEYIAILDANFVGHEDARKAALAVPKFGNDNREVDEIKIRLEHFINETAHEIGLKSELAYYTVANVNPGGITIGPRIAASADGRLCGTPMALGNSPMPGKDKEGLTAMLLSCAKSLPENGGFVTNMNISRETIVNQREKISAAFKTYFQMGGQELNINCFSKGDLEAALIHPEQYKHLIVRVSGYSAKFTSLDAITQKHIMERTLF